MLEAGVFCIIFLGYKKIDIAPQTWFNTAYLNNQTVYLGKSGTIVWYKRCIPALCRNCNPKLFWGVRILSR